MPGKDPVNSWYSEIEKHIFGKKDFDHMIAGHFTQVVWKDSKKLGVGIATGQKGTVVVANYLPPGNYKNRYVENVPPPTGLHEGGANISDTFTVPTYPYKVL